jgi:hypothetical protein
MDDGPLVDETVSGVMVLSRNFLDALQAGSAVPVTAR